MFQYEKITDYIVRSIYRNVEPLTKQRKGSAADYIVDGKYCLEVKYDKMASKTNNIFVEVATELDEKQTPSGISLTSERGYRVMYVIERPTGFATYEFLASDLLTLAKEKGKLTKTRPYSNSNRAGFFGIGYKLPVEAFKDISNNLKYVVLESHESK